MRSSGAQRALMVAVNMLLLTERKNQEPQGYKHVAPPEQEPQHNEDHFSGKGLPAS